MLARLLEPELLDELPATDPRAVASRKDLCWLNAIMLHDRILRNLLLRNVDAPRSILDIGAGDGAFMLRMARHLSKHWPGVEVTLLDRQDLLKPNIRVGFEGLGWRVRAEVADIFTLSASSIEAPFDLVTANLFLHHFSFGQLQYLLAQIAAYGRVFAALEPRRTAMTLHAARALWLARCSAVTCHDAVASARAGFRNREISHAWSADNYALLENGIGFTQYFLAVPRRADP